MSNPSDGLIDAATPWPTDHVETALFFFNLLFSNTLRYLQRLTRPVLVSILTIARACLGLVPRAAVFSTVFPRVFAGPFSAACRQPQQR